MAIDRKILLTVRPCGFGATYGTPWDYKRHDDSYLNLNLTNLIISVV